MNKSLGKFDIMSRVIHFEMHADDPERIRKFYQGGVRRNARSSRTRLERQFRQIREVI
jgi:hypothetical protein